MNVDVRHSFKTNGEFTPENRPFAPKGKPSSAPTIHFQVALAVGFRQANLSKMKDSSQLCLLPSISSWLEQTWLSHMNQGNMTGGGKDL